MRVGVMLAFVRVGDGEDVVDVCGAADMDGRNELK